MSVYKFAPEYNVVFMAVQARILHACIDPTVGWRSDVSSYAIGAMCTRRVVLSPCRQSVRCVHRSWLEYSALALVYGVLAPDVRDIMPEKRRGHTYRGTAANLVLLYRVSEM